MARMPAPADPETVKDACITCHTGEGHWHASGRWNRAELLASGPELCDRGAAAGQPGCRLSVGPLPPPERPPPDVHTSQVRRLRRYEAKADG